MKGGRKVVRIPWLFSFRGEREEVVMSLASYLLVYIDDTSVI
jgi:hypothetical protein